MSVAVSNVVERAAELRRDFDRGFAEPIRLDPIATEDLLAIRIGGQPHAIRLAEIAGLFAGKKITRVPGGHPALSGIAAFRGALLPVYDLALVLGHAGAQAPRWMVIVAALPVALAFDGFEGQFRVPRTDILPQAAHADAPAHAQDIVRTKDFVGPIMHLPSLLDAAKALRSATVPAEERFS